MTVRNRVKIPLFYPVIINHLITHLLETKAMIHFRIVQKFLYSRFNKRIDNIVSASKHSVVTAFYILDIL